MGATAAAGEFGRADAALSPHRRSTAAELSVPPTAALGADRGRAEAAPLNQVSPPTVPACAARPDLDRDAAAEPARLLILE